MSGKQNIGRDPEKRAAKRQRQREAASRGALPETSKKPRPSQSQINHASSGRARKKARDGERKIGNS